MNKRKNILKTTDHLYYILTSQKAKRWMGLISIKFDLEYVGQVLDQINKHNSDKLTNKAFWISCVIIYGKCFTDASKGRGTTLNRKDIFKELPKHKQLHDEIMKMRHNYIAHAGDSVFEKIEPRIRLEMRGDDFYPHLVYQGYTVMGFDQKVLNAFIEIVDFLVDQLEVKTEILGKLVLEEEINTKSNDEMLELIKMQREKDLK